MDPSGLAARELGSELYDLALGARHSPGERPDHARGRDRASDVHIEATEARLRVRYRIDGLLHDMDPPPLRNVPPARSPRGVTEPAAQA